MTQKPTETWWRKGVSVRDHLYFDMVWDVSTALEDTPCYSPYEEDDETDCLLEQVWAIQVRLA